MSTSTSKIPISSGAAAGLWRLYRHCCQHSNMEKAAKTVDDVMQKTYVKSWSAVTALTALQPELGHLDVVVCKHYADVHRNTDLAKVCDDVIEYLYSKQPA